MDRRKFITSVSAGLLAISLGGCNFMSQGKAGQNPATPGANDNSNNQSAANNKKILIAYFSHYGNSKAFAENIQKEVGGDLFAIKPQDIYPQNYDTVVAQAKGEVNTKYTPKLINKVPDIRSYDVIFIGTPIWWYTVAPPVRTFLTEYDLSDKTVIPFSTHKGSGLSGIDKTIKELQPKAKVLEGLAIWDGQVNTKQGDINNWLQRLKL